jgi:hypothetical protein
MLVPELAPDLGAYDVITLAWPLAPSGKRVLLTAGLKGGER